MGTSQGYKIRASRIRELTELHYEPGRQDRCLKWVWRRHVHPQFGIGYRTYLRYIRHVQRCEGYDRDAQLRLFD